MSDSDWGPSHPEYWDDVYDCFGCDPSARFEHWERAAYWTIAEGVALSFGMDPSVVNPATLPDSAHPFTSAFNDRLFLALRAVETGQLDAKCPPDKFTKWAKSNGFPLPQPLAKPTAQRPARDVENPRIRRSLNTIIITLAHEAYGYIPGKGPSPAKEISEAASALNLRISDQTVLSYLNEAADDLSGDLSFLQES